MYLDKISSPADLKKLPVSELQNVADEIREALLNRISRHGGHCGPNLGFTEATVALHYVFDAPADKIVFDVSHQTYPHKMLTGRAFGFLDPKRYDDISGYSSPDESPAYDMFEVGHTSTSIALASGLQKARDLAGGHENIVAVIGDGSLSGGEAFEGFDQAAALASGIIVVVNDNEMSIAENHGGLYGNLKLLRESGGEEPCNYFRAMGFDYMYVADGNDIASLVKAFSAVKGTDHPVVVHIHTEKGHGYAPAVADKEAFHYTGPFDLSTGKGFGDPGENYNDLMGDLLSEQMQKDPRMFVITAGTPTVAGFTRDWRLMLGKQHVDVGIAEEGAVAMLSGAAKGGARPVFNVYGTFLQRTYDQIAQDLCINRNPGVINTYLNGIYGMNDMTHVSFCDIPMLANIPGLLYLAPTCWEETRAMELWALAQREQPVAIRVPSGAPVHRDGDFDIDYATAPMETVVSGSEVALIGVGDFLGLALETAGLLKDSGINATVANPRAVSRIDEASLDALAATHTLVVVVEDGSLDGGFGDKVARHYGPTGVRTLCRGIAKGLYDRFSVDSLMKENRLTPPQIADDIVALLQKIR